MSRASNMLDKKIGPCPVCGKKKWWYNDIPLKAFCWGTEEDEHKEFIIEIPTIVINEATAEAVEN